MGDLFWRFNIVTIYTPAHIHSYGLLYLIHFTYISVTSLAIQTGADMWLVAEINEIGLIVEALPGDGFTTFPKTSKFLYIFAVSGDNCMATHAFFDGRYASYLGSRCFCVAIKTLNSILHMVTMAVGERLIRDCTHRPDAKIATCAQKDENQ